MSKLKLILILGITTGITVILSILDLYLVFTNKFPTLNVEGADGPTSIFIAGKLGHNYFLYAVSILLLITTIVTVVKYKRKKRNAI